MVNLFPPPSQSLDLYAQDPRNYFTDTDGTQHLIPDTRAYGTEPTNLGDTAAQKEAFSSCSWESCSEEAETPCLRLRPKTQQLRSKLH